jgi:hypothetical protein
MTAFGAVTACTSMARDSRSYEPQGRGILIEGRDGVADPQDSRLSVPPACWLGLGPGAASGGADFVVGDLVVEQGVQLGGLGGGMSESKADGFDGDAGVDQFGGVGVAQLVDVGLGRGALAGPAVLGGVVGQWPAGAVDAGAKQRPVLVAGALQVEIEQGDVSAVVE